MFGALFNSVLVCYFVDKPLLTCTIINIHRWISLEGPFAYWTVNVKYDVSSSLSVTNVINGQFWLSRAFDVSNPDLPSMAKCDTSIVTVCTVNQVQCITRHTFMYMIAMSQARLWKIIYKNYFLHMTIYFTLWQITGTVKIHYSLILMRSGLGCEGEITIIMLSWNVDVSLDFPGDVLTSADQSR